MLQYFEERFAGKRAALRVVSAMLRLGLRVDGKGKIYCDQIGLAGRYDEGCCGPCATPASLASPGLQKPIWTALVPRSPVIDCLAL